MEGEGGRGSGRRDGGGMRVESRVGKVWGSGGKGGEGEADGKGASEREGLRLTAHGGFADQVEVRGLGEDGRRDGDRAGSSGSLWRDSKADMMQRSWQCVGCTCDSGETGCNTDERPQLPGSSCAQWHLGDERTARRRRTKVQGIGARERKEDNETAEHRLGNTRGRGATSFSVFAPFLAGGKHGSTQIKVASRCLLSYPYFWRNDKEVERSGSSYKILSLAKIRLAPCFTPLLIPNEIIALARSPGKKCSAVSSLSLPSLALMP